jgi:methionyl-tRNA formyltransferase
MRILLITQEDRFFLPDVIANLISQLESDYTICAAVVSDVSPFGKKERFYKKIGRTLFIFGFLFTARWGFRYLMSIFRRKSVSAVLHEANVDVLRFDKSINAASSLNAIRAYSPDVLISIAGNEIFKRPLIGLAPRGCLNLHTALLPKYRGLMPTFWVLLNRERYTGVSVFQVDEGIDSGPILVQKRAEIQGESQEDLIRKTKLLGVTAILEAIDILAAGDVEFLENNDEEMSYFSFPTREDVKKFLQSGNRFF